MWEAGDLLPKLGLPFPTIFLASAALSDGGFGLVGPPITNAYHLRDLGLNLGQNTITNYYHRTEHITHSDETMCYAGL